MPNRRISDQMVWHIQQLARAGLKATQIEQRLSLLHVSEDNPLGDEDVPALRTIQKYAHATLGELWTLADSDPEEARMVLEMLEWITMQLVYFAEFGPDVMTDAFGLIAARYMAETKIGDEFDASTIHWEEMPRLTRDEAAWVIRLRKAAPSLWPDHAGLLYSIALQYQRTLVGQRQHLDTFLAFHPWASGARAKWYIELLDAGLNKDTGDRLWWLYYAANGIIEKEQKRLAWEAAARELLSSAPLSEDSDASQGEDQAGKELDGKGGDDGTR